MTNSNTVRLAGACMVSVLVAFAAMSFVGCEEATGLSGLNISPSAVELNPLSNSNYVDFVVTSVTSNDLALPITWSVSKPELGYISFSTGYKARYFRYPLGGDNVITARDQYDNTGSALVKQIAE